MADYLELLDNVFIFVQAEGPEALGDVKIPHWDTVVCTVSDKLTYNHTPREHLHRYDKERRRHFLNAENYQEVQPWIQGRDQGQFGYTECAGKYSKKVGRKDLTVS